MADSSSDIAELIAEASQLFRRRYGFPVSAAAIVHPSIATKDSIGNWIAVLITISNPLTVILINRLVLNLRQVSHFQEGTTTTRGTADTNQELAFATNSLLGNIGAPLRMGPEDEEEIELDLLGDDGVNVVRESRIVDLSDLIEEPRSPPNV
ncbi:hypothetical protein BD410DRAFT_842682 [Rickenella mellea]|uniref:Uncharacterized protein n=1 Tax=Rickenella mellea TaxID=50990 RepID=A0A4Y7PVT6_9AGAM|nr:hypothetical protein BD410DRAFT_842682 [Rickenella mellea]